VDEGGDRPGAALMASTTATVEIAVVSQARILDAPAALAAQMDDITTRLARIDRRQAALARAVGGIAEEQTTHDLLEDAQMSDLEAVEAGLEARVTEMVGVEESAATALGALGAKVTELTDELANAGVDPALVAKFEALATTISDEDGKLTAAIAANPAPAATA
jgi:hypothetical protein